MPRDTYCLSGHLLLPVMVMSLKCLATPSGLREFIEHTKVPSTPLWLHRTSVSLEAPTASSMDGHMILRSPSWRCVCVVLVIELCSLSDRLCSRALWCQSSRAKTLPPWLSQQQMHPLVSWILSKNISCTCNNRIARKFLVSQLMKGIIDLRPRVAMEQLEYGVL